MFSGFFGWTFVLKNSLQDFFTEIEHFFSRAKESVTAGQAQSARQFCKGGACAEFFSARSRARDFCQISTFYSRPVFKDLKFSSR